MKISTKYLLLVGAIVVFSLTIPPLGFFLLLIGIALFYIKIIKPNQQNEPKERQNHRSSRYRTYRRERYTVCWQCKKQLSSNAQATCEKCGWLLCDCFACGCNYMKATVIPEWMKGYHSSRIDKLSFIYEIVQCRSCKQDNRVNLSKRHSALCGSCGNRLIQIEKHRLNPNLWLEGPVRNGKWEGFVELKLFIPKHIFKTRGDRTYYDYDNTDAHEVTIALYQISNGSIPLDGDGEVIVLYRNLFYKGMNIDWRSDSFYNSIIRYKGGFLNGTLQGYGLSYELKNDQTFELIYSGEFSSHLRNGKGQEYHKGAVVYDGLWANDRRAQ